MQFSTKMCIGSRLPGKCLR